MRVVAAETTTLACASQSPAKVPAQTSYAATAVCGSRKRAQCACTVRDGTSESTSSSRRSEHASSPAPVALDASLMLQACASETVPPTGGVRSMVTGGDSRTCRWRPSAPESADISKAITSPEMRPYESTPK